MADDTETKKNNFRKDLPMLMYGFGDDKSPLPECVEFVNDIVVEYIRNMTIAASRVSPYTKKIKVQLQDLLFVIRRDRKKYSRSLDLIKSKEVIRMSLSTYKNSLSGDDGNV